MTIDSAIREHRLNQGMTQKQLSLKIHKSERMIKRYEKGEIIPPIYVIGAIFDKSIHELICKGLKEMEKCQEYIIK